MKQIVLIVHNVRSAHNVGSLLRTAEGLGVYKIYLTGYSPYPKQTQDDRLAHMALKTHKNLAKTALGAEKNPNIEHCAEVMPLIDELQSQGFDICALEQDPASQALPDFKPKDKVVLIVGREVEGIEPEILKKVDNILEIPMFGKKESFNVVQAAAMALYHLKFT